MRPYSLTLAARWIHAAEAAHQQVLVSFYHSEYTPTKMPNIKTYEQDTRKFMKDFPNVHQYQPWDETNRGNVRYSYEKYNSPTAVESAEYYKALRHVCPKCTILGLDILDQNEVGPTITVHQRIQDRDPPPADADADALGVAQLLRHEPLLQRTHARDPQSGAPATSG